MTSQLSPHLSDLALDQLLTGDVDANATTQPHLASCASCAARRDQLDAAAQRFRRAAPIEPLVARTQKRLVAKSWRRRLAVAVPTTLAAAALLLVVRAPTPELRAKGGVALDVYRKRTSGAVEALLPESRVQPGDALRFALGAPQPGYAAVVSIDGAGQVSSYFPQAETLAPIARGQHQLLDAAIELDGTLGRERLIALVCTQAAPLDRVRSAVAVELERVHGDAAQVDPARAQPDCMATSFWIDKVLLP
jgi:hypothetical protein